MECIVSASRLIRLNYDLCFLLLGTADQNRNKTQIRHILAAFVSEQPPADCADNILRLRQLAATRPYGYGTGNFVADNKWLFEGLNNVRILDPKLVIRLDDDLSIMKFPWARAGSSGDSYSIDPDTAIREAMKEMPK